MSLPDARVEFTGKVLVTGHASGEIVYSDTPISFWGGVDAATGQVIDRHHPLSGETLAGKILAIPGSRGSCSGSGIILELILNGKNPSALIFEHEEDILTLGVIVADEIFGKTIPVICLGRRNFHEMAKVQFATVTAELVKCGTGNQITDNYHEPSQQPFSPESRLELDPLDQELLDGTKGPACKVAMKIVCRMADLYGANKLVDVTRTHIDGCVYTGTGGLQFATRLKDMGARVSVPTTLNSISIDRRQWRSQGIDHSFGKSAGELADAYVQMGCTPTYTCAPYLLEGAPVEGEQIVWAESNAAVFANSVLGARTMKYPDYLDICIAITGRAPYSGCHIKRNREANLLIKVEKIGSVDDSFFPLLGYQAGRVAGSRIPVITGLEECEISFDDLKAFGAAFATTSSAPMFHIHGVTPEAASLEIATGRNLDIETVEVTVSDMVNVWQQLNTAEQTTVDLISLGNPHFSLSECHKLRDLCRDRTKHDRVRVVITCGRVVFEEAQSEGIISELEEFGVNFITDTCWCMISDPVIPTAAITLMTNSAKYAHYGPGLTGREYCFGSLSMCLDAACTGKMPDEIPQWLKQKQGI